MGGDTVIFCRP